MSRRIIPVLCALAVAVVPATALAQPAQDPSPAVTHGGVAYGDTKYDLQNQQDLKAPATSATAYEQAISGDTKGQLPRAIAPVPGQTGTQVTNVAGPKAAPAATAAPDNNTNGWKLAAVLEAALLAACAIAAVVFFTGRQTRAPRLGV